MVRALVRLNTRFGYLDAAGRFIMPLHYPREDSFSEGIAVTTVAAPHRVKPEKEAVAAAAD